LTAYRPSILRVYFAEFWKNQKCHHDAMMASSKRHHDVLLMENAIMML
jgi:hypothetical protein